MPLTPEEHEALEAGGVLPHQVTPITEAHLNWVWAKYQKKLKVVKLWPPPKLVKKKPSSITVHPKDGPSYVISHDQWDFDEDDSEPTIQYVDAEVEYPSQMKVPMQTRRSNKRVGLTCKAVQLLSKKLDQTCCSECHDFTRRRADHHEMQWVSTPANPADFDVGQAYVCCRYRKICSTASIHGWEKLVNEATKLDPANVWGKLINDAGGCGSHMAKVVELTWLTSVPIFDGEVLAKMGFHHLPTLRVHVKSAWTNAAAIPEEFCINPRCVTCAWDSGSYWSYQLQCWLRYNLYAIFDNALKLSKQHHSLPEHDCASVNHNGTIWITEFDLWTCRYEPTSTNPSLPVWGAMYDVNPKYHAAMKWWDADDHDFRWIMHAPDKDSAPDLSAPYKYLVWEVVGL